MKSDTNIPDELRLFKADLTKIPEKLPNLPLKSQVAFPIRAEYSAIDDYRQVDQDLNPFNEKVSAIDQPIS